MRSLCQSCFGILHSGIEGESFALGVVQGDNPGRIRWFFCHSECVLEGCLTPDHVSDRSSFDEKIFVCRIFFCYVLLSVSECFSAFEDAYMRMDILIVEIRHISTLEDFSKVDHTVSVIVGIGFVSGFVS